MAENYNFSESGVYKSTSKLELDDIRNYINTFPLEDEPEVFGLHNNANITFQNKTVKEFMDTLKSGQPRAAAAKGA
jgi:dynein heavy chain